MKQNTVNILLELGVPAGIKGFTYICDAMELFDTDPYYADGKILRPVPRNRSSKRHYRIPSGTGDPSCFRDSNQKRKT